MTTRPSTYVTKQGNAILDFLKSQQGNHLTAAQIAAHFGSGEAAVGRTTVYRQLDKLVDRGAVRKYVFDENSGACFQYVDEDGGAKEHFHLKCEACGKLIHVDNDAMPYVEKGILKNYAFEIDVGKTVFYGKCRACSGKTQL
ncbi:MAG TPA: transcriptional repressor [Clostridia bacterium]|nr:transcriptional repressor [Clostridia bacterium]